MNGKQKKDTAGEAFNYGGKLLRQRKERIITIDDREDLDRLTQLLLNGMGYATVVERKTPSDARDLSRLSSQLSRLRRVGAEQTIFPIVLIDHRKEYKRPGYEPWSDIDFDNLLLSVQGTVKVCHCLQGQLAHRLDAIYRWSQKSSHGFLEV